jgi:hypothetical protein
MQVLRCALPSTHITSTHADFEIIGCPEGRTLRWTRRGASDDETAEDRQRTSAAGGTRIPVRHTRYQTTAREGEWYKDNPGGKIHGGYRDRTRVVGGRRDTSRRTSPRNQEDDGWELDRTSLAARFAFSLSGPGAPRIPCARLNPSRRQPKKKRRKKPVGDDRGDGEVTAPWLAFAPRIWFGGRMLDFCRVGHRGARGAGTGGERCPQGRCLLVATPTAAGARGYVAAG